MTLSREYLNASRIWRTNWPNFPLSLSSQYYCLFVRSQAFSFPPQWPGSLSSVCWHISMDLELLTSRNLALAGFGAQLGCFWPCKHHLFLLAFSGKSKVQHWEWSPKEPQPFVMCCFHRANPRVPRDCWHFIRQNAWKATHTVSWNWNGMRADPWFHPPENCKHRSGWLHLKPHLSPASWTGAFTTWGFPNKSQDQLLSGCVVNMLAWRADPKHVKRECTNCRVPQGLYFHTLVSVLMNNSVLTSPWWRCVRVRGTHLQKVGRVSSSSGSRSCWRQVTN